MFRLMGLMGKKKSMPASSAKDEVAAMTSVRGRQAAQKCPFMQPLNYGDENGSPIHLFYDCMRDQCKIWDGENCSLHKERI